MKVLNKSLGEYVYDESFNRKVRNESYVSGWCNRYYGCHFNFVCLFCDRLFCQRNPVIVVASSNYGVLSNGHHGSPVGASI
ncbi:hypothetical protein V1264_016100 [Littorina saxatilis]|uniref:Uncharacterized protein n=1 Tax=Littorina saxatilis TaxID=31220 RepID=A0AAN9GIT3_9CAEN